jgi:hypothetical protein
VTPDPARLADLIRRADPLAAAAEVAAAADTPITWTRRAAPDWWLVDGDAERPVDEHRAAHADGRPSEAAVRYGAGVTAEAVAERLLALAALERETGMLRAVCPLPAEGGAERPGSWGVEDLTVIAAARLALPGVPWVRPHWPRLGAATCQLALAFGANDWVLPAGERADPALLAGAVGRRAVER